MKIKDSTIVILLILTWFFIVCGVLGAENEISRMEEQIRTAYGQQDELLRITSELVRQNADQDRIIEEIEYKNVIQDARLDIHRIQLNNSADLFVNIFDDMTELEDKINALPQNRLGLELSESDIRNISALVYLESGSGSDQLQRAIASVIFNRMKRYNMTASQVIWQRGVFSPASRVSRTVPSQRSINAVHYVMNNGCTIPSDVLAFQLGGYHSFGRRWGKIDNVYFTAM